MTKTNTKNRVRLTLVFICIFSFLVLTLTSVGVYMRANAQLSVTTSQEIANEYAFGDEFALPACTFDKNGKSVTASPSLEFPDGTQTNEATVTLNQGGKYVLRYFATIDGKVYTKEYGFTVYGRLASHQSEKTSAEYGRVTHLGADSMGLTLRIANGDVITFDHVFDMTKMTPSVKLVEGFVLPNAHGAVDFSKMIFTFTDVEDPSVQLVYNGNFHNDSRAYGLTYFTAAGNGQVQCGLEHVGRLHKGSTLGCVVPHSFMAMDTGLFWGHLDPTPVAPDQKLFCISYDHNSRQAWAGGKIISDLDDSAYYDKLWFGFPSGKAKLSISAANYNDVTANICITKIEGIDLSAKNYVDEEAPVITVNNTYEKMPNAVVGGSYPVPTATAIDQVSGESSVSVSVWHNYGMQHAKMVDVVEGRFKVNDVGMYAIIYEATDFSGNTRREILWVRAYLESDIEKLSVTIPDGYENNVVVGTLKRIPEVDTAGGCGEVRVSYELTKGRVTSPITGGTFCLEEAGEWTLSCTATDYVGNVAVAICVLNAEVSEQPILADVPQFPVAYISGSTYVLPKLYAYDYSAGSKQEKLCQVTVECGGETKTYDSGENFTPKVKEDGTLKLTYSCDGYSLLEKEIPVRVVLSMALVPGSTNRQYEVVNVEKYFYTEDDLTIVNNYELAGYNGLKITANSPSEKVKVVFINPLMASNFSLDLMSVAGASKFSEISLCLRDSVDASVQVSATVSKGKDETVLTVGGASISLNVDFDGASSSFNLGFDGKDFIIDGTTSVAVATTDDGRPFQGFPSGKLYFELALHNVEEGGAIFIDRVCNISVSNNQDTIGPFISTQNSVVENAFKDTVYTVQKVIVGDVLCPNTEALLTVISPSGEVVTSLDGTPLQGADATVDYDIMLTEYGEYIVSVEAKEVGTWQASNKAYFDYMITVIDGEKPTISFKDDFKKNLKVGDLLVIPKFTVSDNHSTAEEITVIKMIINPNGMPIMLYDDVNAVRCEYAGAYTVLIYVYDQLGNLTTFETTVTVK
ncbi:MAG: hypothetical protein IJ308_05240 [Clostridia bacterium]|nr:hypothetical protein [Clostridia bacterium]